MKCPMRNLILILLVTCLIACAGPGKNKQNIAVYDFGLPATGDASPLLQAQTVVLEVSAADAINTQQIRYRLNYDNPSRVFTYTESRWAATPAELLTGKLGSLVQQGNDGSGCSVRMKVQVFDHVFSSITASEGVVQLSAILLDRKSRKIIASEVVTETAVAATANAQGGTKALAQASESALVKVINWANTEAANNASCQTATQ